MSRGYRGVAGLFDDAFDAGVSAVTAPARGSQERILPISPFSPSSSSARRPNLAYAAPKRNTVNVEDVSPERRPTAYKQQPNSATPVTVSEVNMLSRAIKGAVLSNRNMKLGTHKRIATKRVPNTATSVASVAAAPSSNSPLPHLPAMGFGGAGGVTAGALIGGTTAYMGSTQENRGFGTFMKGAAFGAGAGAVVSGIASRGMISGGAEWSNQVAKKFEFGEGFTENAMKVAQGMETAQARGALFAAGAMLGGGMFGTNRNRAQGLNSTRGNRFGG